ncbi:hypothetical protein [Thermococcus sp. LS1]|uniref:hypothetical protein n=1 Tax=Thermococcus sp. LS1 TaxID=1638259 RepID=UPI001F0E3A6E|nr:hypothetical protein [Thermococcus sp. LS1]
MKRTLYRLHMLTSSFRIVGDAIESIALPWSLLNSTGSLVSIGGYALFTHLPWVILPPLLGRTLDRTTKKVRLAFLALILQAFLAVLIIPSPQTSGPSISSFQGFQLWTYSTATTVSR